MDYRLLEYLHTFLTPRRSKLFAEVVSRRTRHFTVAMEDVYQLHNTSAVTRSCDAFGIQDLHVIEQKARNRIDKEIAMGAQKWVDVHRYATAGQCISALRAKGYRIIATSPHKKAHPLEEFDISQKAALFFGREGDGLSGTVLDAADGYLYIPMDGFTESLNISVSAAIILQRVTIQVLS